jgi:galactokinase
LQASHEGIAALRDVSPKLIASAASGMSPVAARRARFIVDENDWGQALAEALLRGAGQRLGELMAASYEGAHDLFEIGSPAMTAMMAAMTAAPGLIGARQAGSGFGGCMVAVVEEAEARAFAAAVVERYRRDSGLTAHVCPVRPAAEAGILYVFRRKELSPCN